MRFGELWVMACCVVMASCVRNISLFTNYEYQCLSQPIANFRTDGYYVQQTPDDDNDVHVICFFQDGTYRDLLYKNSPLDTVNLRLSTEQRRPESLGPKNFGFYIQRSDTIMLQEYASHRSVIYDVAESTFLVKENGLLLISRKTISGALPALLPRYSIVHVDDAYDFIESGWKPDSMAAFPATEKFRKQLRKKFCE